MLYYRHKNTELKNRNTKIKSKKDTDMESNSAKRHFKENRKKVSLKSIQNMFFQSQIILILAITFILGVSAVLINIHFETEKRDQNLQNVAEAIACSPILTREEFIEEDTEIVVTEYLDALKDMLDDIDVISVVNRENIRIYHSNHAFINTRYDGNLPDFTEHSGRYYAVDETGVSGRQRRAYAAIYNEEGEYVGFVMAIMLMKNIRAEIFQQLLLSFLIAVAAIFVALLIAKQLSGKIKTSLMGYEPDAFSAMYKMRDNILKTLKEGILAVDEVSEIQFVNDAAIHMLCDAEKPDLVGKNIDVFDDAILSDVMKHGEKETNVHLEHADILLDRVPIEEEGHVIGAVAILHNRAEYTKLMEDLSGTRYLVDSMRANNHDFTNKLHVILGLIQMEMYEEATSYIQNITMVQRENISRIMQAVDEPAVAALLIGKIARASELNIKFVLREECYYSSADLKLPSEMLITVLGNLLDNAFDAMNETEDFEEEKELVFGIYSKPGAVLITVDDTGSGISVESLKHIFENGYSTKGEGRGTGLYQVKMMVENYGGKITVESQEGVGTSFAVSFSKEK